MEKKVPLILDTDIGSDIDDAVCLTYLLAEPRCDLLGITTVTGQARERAMLADAVCRAAGRTDVPIHSGCEQPLFCDQKQKLAPQAEVLPDWEHSDEFAPGEAVEFLRSAIRSRPGEITLLTIGPLTNAGLLFAADPETAKMLKRLVMMGGCYFADRNEWNTAGDPYCSRLVFEAEIEELTAYGLDVTLQCSMPAAECRGRFRGGPFDLVREMAEVWFRGRDRITFHDPLAAACIFEPGLCRYEQGCVNVDTSPGEAFGRTRFDREPGGPHSVAAEVDAERFFEHYFRVTDAFRSA